MAYNMDGLRVLACNETGGLALWSYKTTDAWDEIVEPGYFSEAHGLLRVGDFMMVNAETDTGTVAGVVIVLSKLPKDVVVGELVAPVSYGASVVEVA